MLDLRLQAIICKQVLEKKTSPVFLVKFDIFEVLGAKKKKEKKATVLFYILFFLPKNDF